VLIENKNKGKKANKQTYNNKKKELWCGAVDPTIANLVNANLLASQTETHFHWMMLHGHLHVLLAVPNSSFL